MGRNCVSGIRNQSVGVVIMSDKSLGYKGRDRVLRLTS